jgi:hypothetical protein
MSSDQKVFDFLAVTTAAPPAGSVRVGRYLAKERRRRAAQVKIVESTVALWNRFAEETGSFADDHPTL